MPACPPGNLTHVSSHDLARYADTRDPQLRDHLIVGHLPLVKFVARKMMSSLPAHIDFDDLVSWGTMGLIDSLDKFDPSLGHKFSTYAVVRIRGAVLDGLQKNEWAPKQVTSKVRALMRTINDLSGRLGRAPTHAEIAEELSWSEIEVRDWLRERGQFQPKHLYESVDEEDSAPQHDLRQDADQDVAGEIVELQQLVASAIGQLAPRERAVFLLYYRDGLTLREIAAQLRVSVSSVTQTHTRLVEQVRLGLAALGGTAA